MLSRLGPLCTEPQDSSWQGPEGGESKEVPLKGAGSLQVCFGLWTLESEVGTVESEVEVGSAPFINENAESQEASEGHSRTQHGSDPVFDGF